jgi:hypothetical protein
LRRSSRARTRIAAGLFIAAAIAGQLGHGVKQSLEGETSCVDWFRRDFRRTLAAMIGNVFGMIIFIQTGVLGPMLELGPKGFFAIILFGLSNGFSPTARSTSRRARRGPMRSAPRARSTRTSRCREALLAMPRRGAGGDRARHGDDADLRRRRAARARPVRVDCGALAENITCLADSATPARSSSWWCASRAARQGDGPAEQAVLEREIRRMWARRPRRRGCGHAVYKRCKAQPWRYGTGRQGPASRAGRDA